MNFPWILIPHQPTHLTFLFTFFSTPLTLSKYASSALLTVSVWYFLYSASAFFTACSLLTDPAFSKIFPVITSAKVFEPLVIHGKALDDVLFKSLCGPNAELRGNVRLYAVTKGNNQIKIVMLNIIVFTVFGSCSEFPNN